MAFLNFYPRPPRGGRRTILISKEWRKTISIHALLAEGDSSVPAVASFHPYFYPRPPRGGRPGTEGDPLDLAKFLSTPSARRATGLQKLAIESDTLFLSTPSARRATRLISIGSDFNGISIHALREEGDGTIRKQKSHRCNFYPRPPRGGRRNKPRQPSANSYFYPRPPRGGRRENDTNYWAEKTISIHALREEGDCLGLLRPMYQIDFYPRPPRGGRP